MSSQGNLAPRRKQCVCKFCGSEFHRTTNQRTCSPACRDARAEQLYRERYAKEAEKYKAKANKRYKRTHEEVVAKLKHRYATDPAFRERCQQRSSATRERRKAADPHAFKLQWRDRYLKKTYGITHQEYDQLLLQQGGGCAICKATVSAPGTTNNLAVDHCHDSGKVRGILCAQCNRGLGSFRDTPELLIRAAEYIKESNDASKS